MFILFFFLAFIAIVVANEIFTSNNKSGDPQEDPLTDLQFTAQLPANFQTDPTMQLHFNIYSNACTSTDDMIRKYENCQFRYSGENINQKTVQCFSASSLSCENNYHYSMSRRTDNTFTDFFGDNELVHTKIGFTNQNALYAALVRDYPYLANFD
jgi:hypothetical protein